MVSLTGTNTRQPLQWALAGGHEAKHRPGNEKWWKMTCTWDELGIDSLRYYIYIIIVIICQWLYNSILNPGDPSQYETPSKNRQKPAFWDHLGATKIRGMGLLNLHMMASNPHFGRQVLATLARGGPCVSHQLVFVLNQCSLHCWWFEVTTQECDIPDSAHTSSFTPN